jgi:hypothetical protein
MDLNYRRQWDHYKPDALRVLNELPDTPFPTELTQRIYWRQEYTWPIQNRDYCLERQASQLEVNGETTWVVLTRSLPATEAEPEHPGHIRVLNAASTLVLQPSPATPFSTSVYFWYHEDPRGKLPGPIYNQLLTHSVPSWLKRFVKACNAYGQDSTEDHQHLLDGAAELKDVLEESMRKGFVL